MPLFRRPDGDVIKDLPLMRRIMPYIMPGRNESVVYHDAEYQVAEARDWLDEVNRLQSSSGGEKPPEATLFHLFLWGCARALHERPGLNRFVSGREIYQRRGVSISFAAKKAFRDDAPIKTCKVEIPKGQSFAECVARVTAAVGESRSDKDRPVDKELKLMFLLPSALVGFGVRRLMWLDRMNLMPGAMIDSDPMFASLFLANLGSVGIDEVTHHLYEYGNVSLFGAMGTAGPRIMVGPDGQPVVRDAVKVRWSFDERINDGFYCAKSLELVREAVESPRATIGEPGAVASMRN